MGQIARRFADKGVDYTLIYITEAHPRDGWMPQWAPAQFASTDYAKSCEERLATARAFVATLGLVDTPVLVDSMADEYAAPPQTALDPSNLGSSRLAHPKDDDDAGTQCPTFTCAVRACVRRRLENRYEARPERLYVVQGGRVLWRCGLGPFEYDAPGLAAFLESKMS